MDRSTQNEEQTAPVSKRKKREPEERCSWPHQLKRLPWLLLIPLGLLLPVFVRNHPEQVEANYSRSIYPVISRAVGAVSSKVPTSLAEILIVVTAALLALVLVIRILRVIFGKLRNRRRNRIRLFSFLITLGILAGVLLNLFYVMWGFNHFRKPASALFDLDVRPRSKEELVEAFEHLAQEAAELREQVAVDEKGIFTVGDPELSFNGAAAAFRALGAENELFANTVYPAKRVIMSETLSKLNIAGIYIPYTAEANVNTDQPDLFLPSGAAHELAHYMGFAREDEADFIAFYVSRFSNDASLRYSSTMLALNYCASELYKRDSKLFGELYERLYTEGMRRDFADYSEYYKKYENEKAAKVNDKVNDTYLKYNGQQDGINSYGRMLDLLLAYYASGRS